MSILTYLSDLGKIFSSFSNPLTFLSRFLAPFAVCRRFIEHFYSDKLQNLEAYSQQLALVRVWLMFILCNQLAQLQYTYKSEGI